MEHIKKWLTETYLPDNTEDVWVLDNVAVNELTLRVLSAYSETGPLVRHRLRDSRKGITHHFEIRSQEPVEVIDGYIIANTYEDGKLAEVFLRCGLQGTMISGLLDSLSIMISLALQYGIPLQHICDKLRAQQFNPQGYSGREFGFAKSIVDYVARYLYKRYIQGDWNAFKTADDAQAAPDSGTGGSTAAGG